VVEKGKLIGVITSNDLLPEIGRSYDPLTELPWADTLREWAIDHLQRGMEITVLFLDIDRFGQFNKLYGHVIGDEVLQAVAQALKAILHPDNDLLCRFGGDEFCIATLRSASEAGELAARIASRIEAIEVPSLSGARITCTIGQFGGKRTKEREHMHYAATMNSLINLASRDCMSKKPGTTYPSANSAATTMTLRESSECLRLARVDVAWDNGVARVTVNLQLGPEEGKETHPREPHETPTYFTATGCAETDEEGDEEGVVRLVAETTFNAIHGALPEEYQIRLTDVFLSQTSEHQQLITVVGQLEAPTHRMSLVGSALVIDGAYRAAATAVLTAVNRPLGAILAQRAGMRRWSTLSR
jgi:diguanylate cyclase (GGDEF)-like protein